MACLHPLIQISQIEMCFQKQLHDQGVFNPLFSPELSANQAFVLSITGKKVICRLHQHILVLVSIIYCYTISKSFYIHIDLTI